LFFTACSDSSDSDADVSDSLTWQDPPSSDALTWEEAIAYCEELKFNGVDDWRLPTISELRSLIQGCEWTETNGTCRVTDDCTEWDCWNNACRGCEYLEGPGSGGAYWPDRMSGNFDRQMYWSSSTVAESHRDAWGVWFDFGFVSSGDIYEDGLVRCIRP